MNDLDIIKECRQTGRTRTTTKNLLEKAYDEQMTKNNSAPDIIAKWGEENKPPTLYQIIRDELGYSHDCTAEIIDAVSKWLPKENSRPSYDTMQWDKCVRMMWEKLE